MNKIFIKINNAMIMIISDDEQKIIKVTGPATENKEGLGDDYKAFSLSFFIINIIVIINLIIILISINITINIVHIIITNINPNHR